MNSTKPLVSIGLPVFNSECTIEKALESLLNQSYSNIEILISNNASTDRTRQICENYAQKDSRIKIFHQSSNIGPGKNYQKVLDESRGAYFMWAASDDYRSLDFVELNINFLENNHDYVASTSPNYMEGNESNLVIFSLTGEKHARFHTFFRNAWHSHGIFYSLMRTDVIRQCDIVDQFFLGTDWAVDLFLASSGKIARLEHGLTVFGTKGISNSSNVWSRFRTSKIEWFLPFLQLSLYTCIKLLKDLTLLQRLSIICLLIKLNITASYAQAKSEIKEILLNSNTEQT